MASLRGVGLALIEKLFDLLGNLQMIEGNRLFYRLLRGATAMLAARSQLLQGLCELLGGVGHGGGK